MSSKYFGSFRQVAVSVSMINLFVGVIDTHMQVWWREHCLKVGSSEKEDE